MCKLSSLFFSFACHWLHVLYWCLVPGTWPSCLWKEALQLACLIRRKKSFLGLVTPQKPMVMFHCTLCPHYVYLYVCLSIYLYKDWHIMYLCIYLHVRALLLLLLVQCPLYALKIISCSANQSLANVFKIVCHLQISSNMSWKCFTSSSKMTYQISMFWCFGFFFFLMGFVWTENFNYECLFFLQFVWLFSAHQNMNPVDFFIRLSEQTRLLKHLVFVKKQAPLEYNISWLYQEC